MDCNVTKCHIDKLTVHKGPLVSKEVIEVRVLNKQLGIVFGVRKVAGVQEILLNFNQTSLFSVENLVKGTESVFQKDFEGNVSQLQNRSVTKTSYVLKSIPLDQNCGVFSVWLDSEGGCSFGEDVLEARVLNYGGKTDNIENSSSVVVSVVVTLVRVTIFDQSGRNIDLFGV